MSETTITEKCVGCRTCEIACSYHHKQLFSRSISSIEVMSQEGKRGFVIKLHGQDENGHLACDKCGLCLKYCPLVARDELKAILQYRKS